MSEFIYSFDGVTEQGIETYMRREEIVRCRDCKFYKCGDDGWWCLRSISTKSNHPDGFCAWGERKVSEPVEVWNQWSVDDVTCWKVSE